MKQRAIATAVIIAIAAAALAVSLHAKPANAKSDEAYVLICTKLHYFKKPKGINRT